MRSSVRPSSLRTYGMQWRTVLQFLPGSQLVQDLSRQTIQAAINRMADAGYQPRTVQGMVRALHRVIRPLLLDRVLSHDPLQGIELPAVLDRPPRFLTREQRQRVLEVAESRGSDVHLFFGIALYAGLRCGELLTLRGEHIDLRRKLIVVTNDEHFRTKSGRSRTVPICQDLWTILGRYRRRRGWLLWPRQTAKVLGPRFDTRRLVVSIGKEAGVPWLRPHTMRHTFATLGADAGVSLVKLQAWLGHRSLMSTQVYLHALAGWDDDIDKLAS
jgi:integrase